jgi:hypothetical protein
MRYAQWSALQFLAAVVSNLGISTLSSSAVTNSVGTENRTEEIETELVGFHFCRQPIGCSSLETEVY